MPKNSWNDYSATAASNTDIAGIDIDENCAPSGLNNAIRAVLAHTADVVAGTTALSSINIDGGSITGITDLAVADGGTGASDAATARTNLGLAIGSNVAAAGANSDITSLSGLTTALSTGQGGTGLTSFGTAGQVLTVNSGATALEYADAAGGGKVLQIVSASLATQDSTTSSSFVDTSLSVNITPTATTSKFWVNCMVFIGGYRNNDTSYSAAVRFKETAVTSDVYPSTTHGFGYGMANDPTNYGQYIVTGAQMQWLHAPTLSDTSTLTYKCQYKNMGDTGYFNYAGTSGTAVITVTEIGA